MPDADGSPALDILLVDDDEEDALMTREAIDETSAPCRVNLVRDGEQALRVLRREGEEAGVPLPAIILLDMHMPKMGGREVLREIHRDGRWPHIRVYVMTASLVHRAVLEAEGLRPTGFLTKPVSADQLRQIVGLVRR